MVLRLQRVPRAVIDAGLAVGLAVAITIAIGVSPEPGARHDPAAYVLGWTIAALVLVRRRWPLAVLLASAIILQLYYELDYPGIYPAVPLSIALATAWAAGHRLWSLLVAGLFVAAGVGVGYQALAPNQPALQVLGDVTRDLVLFAPSCSSGRRCAPVAPYSGRRSGPSGCCSTCCRPPSLPGSRSRRT